MSVSNAPPSLGRAGRGTTPGTGGRTGGWGRGGGVGTAGMDRCISTY